MGMSSWAQREQGSFTLYPRIGVNLSTYSGDDIYTTDYITDETVAEATYRVGFTVGLEEEYMVTRHLGASLGLFYTNSGMRNETLKGNMGNASYSTSFSKTDHQFQVPLMANLHIGNFTVKAGVQCSYVAKIKGKIKDTITPYSDYSDETAGEIVSNNTDFTDSMKKNIRWSIPVGIGYEYRNFNIDLRYHIPLSKVYDYKQLQSINHIIMPNAKQKYFLLTIGYALQH